MKIVTVVGARPQFIKAGVVSRALRRIPHVQEVLVHTGQHYDENMSETFFREMSIPAPDYNLNVGSASHGAQTGRMMEALENVLLREIPDWALVYGDTNSTLAGALVAAKLHVPVAHVEAGLRSFNRSMPEEINRVLTDHASDLLFAPTQESLRNLAKEGVPSERVEWTGDVMYDAALFYGARAVESSTILEDLGVAPRQYLLCTVHRAENTDEPHRLAAIVEALRILSRELTVVLPLHPRTRKVLQQRPDFAQLTKNLRIIDPVGYLDMVMLEKNAAAIATDSGGVQKEAFFHGVPCITLRDETEWVELLKLGVNRLAPPTDANTIVHAVLAALLTTFDSNEKPYGEGDASERIARRIVSSRPLALGLTA